MLPHMRVYVYIHANFPAWQAENKVWLDAENVVSNHSRRSAKCERDIVLGIYFVLCGVFALFMVCAA